MRVKPDFEGWATKNDLRCSDGKIIRRDAFKDQDGQQVPLVWMHQHNNIEDVLGHAILENRKDGVYAYCYLNGSEKGQYAKSLIDHRDVGSLSIYANNLTQQNGNVTHGVIREVSLVLAGANPGASIIFPGLAHGENVDPDTLTEAEIYTGEDLVYLEHSDGDGESPENKEETKSEEKGDKEMPKEKTVKDVFDELTEEQKKVVYFMIGNAVEQAKGGKKDNNDEEDDEEMKHNVFETDQATGNYLTHADQEMIFKDAKRLGSLKDSVLEHAEDYGIDGIEWLFPEDHELNRTPEFIDRDQSWVSVVMNGVSHTPFSRVKTSFADITEDEARAKGYFKGNLKKNEVFTLLKRNTTPQTVYKKQKLDRDDIIDITDFDVVSWIKGEMRGKLNEELARAYLIGDGRESSDDDKISEDHIRPIATDAGLFTIYQPVTTAANATDDVKAKAFIRAAIKSRKNYKGSGNPTLFTTEDWLTEMLLLEDEMGRPLYDDQAKLATKLRVKNIVTVEVMENAEVRNAPLMGIIVNLKDYTVGADKGGAINMFEDFDIDYNQQKYLIETRCSGALTKPFSAIVLTDGTAGTDSDTHGVTRSKTTYTEVEPEENDNPKAKGWYEASNGKYVQTNDTTVQSGKTYYERHSAV